MAVLISGVPGSGKTHLARQYVFTYREFYPGGIFWIDSKSREASFKCFWEIAQTAALFGRTDSTDTGHHSVQTYVNEVRNWLQTREGWILVFDGISFNDDSEINLFRNCLPWNKNCSIIYTSVDTTLRKKHRLYEPYCLMIPRLQIDDACSLLFKDLGIKRPTPEQKSKATQIVEHYECLPLAIHAIGHRLNATGKPIEKYRVKSQVTDKKLAEPFLSIMNDLFRLKQYQALHLINLLSFLGHQIPVGLLDLGRSVMSAENLEIQTSARSGDIPDLDTTLGTLIHYGLIERTSDADVLQQRSSMHTSDSDGKSVPNLSESLTESSQDDFYSNYRHNSEVDVVKIHSVVQGFCRDELRIQDEEFKGLLKKGDSGYFDMWLMTTTRFLVKSFETAVEKMKNYPDCGLVRDYREYETHASRLAELYPKKPPMSLHASKLGESRGELHQLMKRIRKQIRDISPSSSQHLTRHQKSVFDRSSSSSSSYWESSAGGGLSRRSTVNISDPGEPRTESPEQMVAPPQFKLDLFAPHIYRKSGYGPEDGYETDGEPNDGLRISPSSSQISQITEKPTAPPPSSSPSGIPALSRWRMVHRPRKKKLHKERKSTRGKDSCQVTRQFTDTNPLVEVSSIQGHGSSSRTPSSDTRSSLTLASEAKRSLTAVSQCSRPQAPSETPKPTVIPPLTQETMPTFPKPESLATRRIFEVESAFKGPSSVPVFQTLANPSGLQVKPSAESLDGRLGYAFASPLSHEWTPREPIFEPRNRFFYSDTEIGDPSRAMSEAGFHTVPESQAQSRRASLAHLEVPRGLSASVPALVPYPPPLPCDEDISITRPRRRKSSQLPSGSVTPSHPSVIMPGALSPPSHLSLPIDSASEHPIPASISRGSSGFSGSSHQSWATEPVHYPPRFSPFPGFTQHPEATSSTSISMEQPKIFTGNNSWTSDISMGSTLHLDPIYSGPPQRRLSSVDERVKFRHPGWNPDFETSQYLHLGGYRADVRDTHQGLHESASLQAPHHVPQYRLYHPNLSGPLIQHDGHLYAPASQLEPLGTRPRSGSSPSGPGHAGLGVRFP